MFKDVGVRFQEDIALQPDSDILSLWLLQEGCNTLCNLLPHKLI